MNRKQKHGTSIIFCLFTLCTLTLSTGCGKLLPLKGGLFGILDDPNLPKMPMYRYSASNDGAHPKNGPSKTLDSVTSTIYQVEDQKGIRGIVIASDNAVYVKTTTNLYRFEQGQTVPSWEVNVGYMPAISSLALDKDNRVILGTNQSKEVRVYENNGSSGSLYDSISIGAGYETSIQYMLTHPIIQNYTIAFGDLNGNVWAYDTLTKSNKWGTKKHGVTDMGFHTDFLGDGIKGLRNAAVIHSDYVIGAYRAGALAVLNLGDGSVASTKNIRTTTVDVKSAPAVKDINGETHFAVVTAKGLYQYKLGTNGQITSVAFNDTDSDPNNNIFGDKNLDPIYSPDNQHIYVFNGTNSTIQLYRAEQGNSNNLTLLSTVSGVTTDHAPILSNDGYFYVAANSTSGEGQLLKITTTGNLDSSQKFAVTGEGTLTVYPVITSGSVYIGTSSGKVYQLKD